MKYLKAVAIDHKLIRMVQLKKINRVISAILMQLATHVPVHVMMENGIV